MAGSHESRTVAIRHNAWLAWRLPARFRRWRMVFPDDASTGEAPQRAAKLASLRRRWVIAAGHEQYRGHVWPDALGASESRVGPSSGAR